MNVQEVPLQPADLSYKSSSFKAMVDWKESTTSHKTLSTIAADDPRIGGHSLATTADDKALFFERISLLS